MAPLVFELLKEYVTTVFIASGKSGKRFYRNMISVISKFLYIYYYHQLLAYSLLLIISYINSISTDYIVL